MNGQQAEDRALEHLLSKGHTLLERNFRIRGGEIDLVTRLGEITVFTEVKHRSSASHGLALESVSPKKAALIRRAALHYLKRDDLPCRFDLIALQGPLESAHLLHLEDAF